MGTLTNRTLQDITVDGTTYRLEIAIKNTFVEAYDSFHFALYQRNSEANERIPHTSTENHDDYTIYQIQLDVDDLEYFFSNGDTFDLVIIRGKSDEEKHSRVKSNYEHFEFLRQQLNEDTILFPATTKMGNVSFYKREDYLLAKMEELSIASDAVLHAKGFFLPPKDIKPVEAKLVVTSNQETRYIPIQRTEIAESYQHHSWYEAVHESAFEAIVDLKPYTTNQETQHLKLHLQITTDTGEVIQSRRMKLNHLRQNYPIIQNFRRTKITYRVTIKPTKLSKYLSVRISEYRLTNEIKQRIKENWVQFRRSKELLKVFSFAFKLFGKLLPVNKKLVMFESFHGKQFSDNPRAIYEYMQKNNPNYKLIWSFDRRHLSKFNDRDLLMVRRFSVRWLFLMSRANYWVTNARLPLWIPKPKHTIYLQTWHGTPLKRLATDMEEVHMPGTNTEKYKGNFTKEASKWDYLISPNLYSSKIFRRAFQFENQLIESGYPRNDYLYHANKPEEIIKLKEQLGMDPTKKVILYAPTWRDNQFYQKGKYKFRLQLDLEKMQKAFGDTYVIALRLHYLVAESLDISAFEGFVYDFSTHEDIRDLYLIADMLVTDYSSVFFDYANLERPMFFYVYDIEEYRDHLRGFYFDFEKKAPGPLTKTTDDLIYEIKRIQENGYALKEEFYNRFCYLEDGNAAKRVVERVFR